MTSSKKIAAFRRIVWKYWKEHGRHDLPWRKTKDPYRILVSEVMLQQTQVPRVIEKYKEFLKKFPTVRALAKASLSDVLRVWSGLGYNRRGKYLHDAAKEIVAKHRGNLRRALQNSLPGVGPYTKAAVKAFAFNEPDVLIETNIRTAFIQHSHTLKSVRVSDKELLPFVIAAAEGQDPRTWNWALMDYGAHLKRIGVRNNHRSVHYTKQSKFEGSLRQVRGAILRALQTGPQTDTSLYSLIRANRRIVLKALAGLARDGLIVKVSPRLIGPGSKKGKWKIA